MPQSQPASNIVELVFEQLRPPDEEAAGAAGTRPSLKIRLRIDRHAGEATLAPVIRAPAPSLQEAYGWSALLCQPDFQDSIEPQFAVGDAAARARAAQRAAGLQAAADALGPRFQLVRGFCTHDTMLRATLNQNCQVS